LAGYREAEAASADNHKGDAQQSLGGGPRKALARFPRHLKTSVGLSRLEPFFGGDREITSVSTSRASLEERFKAFLGQLDNVESIDDTLPDAELTHGKRADFLLDGRRVVLEIKSLKADPEYKIEERLAPHRKRPEFPAFYWDADLNEILPYLSDGEDVRREIVHAVTRSVQGALEKADDQIRATKKGLGLENSCGVVAMLNERVGILAPELVTGKASQMLLKTRDGTVRYNNIAYVWIISESHRLATTEWNEHLPLILLEGPTADAHAEAGEYLDSLQLKWAAFEGIPFVSLGRRTDFDGLNFVKRTGQPTKTEKKPLVRHELWRRAYRARPYLRLLAEEEPLQHAVHVLSALTPHFLVGGRKLPTAKVVELMERWTHILEEAEYRRLDMRKLQSRMSDPGDLRGGSD
jgi:hypothetical protein